MTYNAALMIGEFRNLSHIEFNGNFSILNFTFENPGFKLSIFHKGGAKQFECVLTG